MAIDYAEVFRRLGFFISSTRRLNYLRDVLGTYEEKVWVFNDTSGPAGAHQLKNFKFKGLSQEKNVGAGDQLWVELTDAASTRKVEIFRDSGKITKVASGTRSGDGVLAFSEVGDSGLSGEVYVTYNADDTDIYLTLDIPWPRKTDAYEKDDLDKDIADAKSDLDSESQGVLEGIPGDLAAISSSLRSVLDSYYWLGFIAKLINSAEPSVWLYTERRGADGGITIEESGVLQDFVERMVADSTTIQPDNTTTLPAGTPGSGNIGELTEITRVPYDYVRNETVKVRCTKTLDSSLEQFEVIGSLAGTAQNRLTLNSLFKSNDLGIELQLDRKAVYDTSGQLSNVTISGEQSTNVSSAGTLYTRLSNPSGTIYKLECYTNSARTDEYKVAEGQRDGNGTIIARTYAGSGLEVTATLTWTGAEDGLIDLHVIHVNDLWYFYPTNDEANMVLTMIGRLYPGVILPNQTSGTLSADVLAQMPQDSVLQIDGWDGLE